LPILADFGKIFTPKFTPGKHTQIHNHAMDAGLFGLCLRIETAEDEQYTPLSADLYGK